MGTLCLVSTKFEFIWLEDGISPLGIPRRNAAGRFADQLARRSIAAAGRCSKEKSDDARPASGRGRDIGRGARRPPNNRMTTPRETSVAAVPSMS